MLKKEYKVCCFTGHRTLPLGRIDKTFGELQRLVRYVYDCGVREFRAGGALGFDTLAALTVLDLRESCHDLRLCLYLPCRDQDAGWSERDRWIYQGILHRADSVVYTEERYCSGCMQRRNRALVDGSDVCIALCGRSSGGSAYTVRYAKEQGLEIWNLWDI